MNVALRRTRLWCAQEARGPGGLILHYEESEIARIVVLIHGRGASSRFWTSTLRRMEVVVSPWMGECPIDAHLGSVDARNRHMFAGAGDFRITATGTADLVGEV